MSAGRQDSAAAGIPGLQLDEGETLQWAGRPAQGLALVGRDALLIPFSLLWCSFAIFWLNAAIHPQAGRQLSTFSLLFGSAFVAIGLYFVFGRFVADAYYRSRLWYAVTDRRVLIVERAFGTAITTIDLGMLGGMRLIESDGGRGTVELTAASSVFDWNRSSFSIWHATIGRAPALFRISDAKTVYDLLRRLHARDPAPALKS